MYSSVFAINVIVTMTCFTEFPTVLVLSLQASVPRLQSTYCLVHTGPSSVTEKRLVSLPVVDPAKKRALLLILSMLCIATCHERSTKDTVEC